MAVKKRILVVNFCDKEEETFSTKEEAEGYINYCLDAVAEIDEFNVYEITKQFCLGETTRVTITEC